MLFCMLLMYTTAHHRIRQQSFETFWYTHHLFIPFLLGMYTHAVGCFVRDTADGFSPFAGAIFWEHCIGYQGWRWEVFGGAIYLIERLYREVRARRETKITRVVRHPYGTLCPEETCVYMILIRKSHRRRRGSVFEAFFQVQGRPMALLATPIRIPIPVASFHDYFLSVRPLRIDPHSSSR